MDTSVILNQSITTAFDGALLAWADSTTDASSGRRRDLLHDKVRALTDFFEWTGKPIDKVKPGDVKEWQLELERRGLSPATVYAMVSRVSSFYDWAMQAPEIAGRIASNPVRLARPKAPKPYRSESVKALDDEQVHDLLQEVRARGDVIGKRDYALLLFYLLTGMRRAEIAG